MGIKVTNLPGHLSDDEIQSELAELFSSYGPISFYRPIEVGEDENEKVAYVELSNATSETDAVSELDRKKTPRFSNPIRVGSTRPRRDSGNGQSPPSNK